MGGCDVLRFLFFCVLLYDLPFYPFSLPMDISVNTPRCFFLPLPTHHTSYIIFSILPSAKARQHVSQNLHHFLFIYYLFISSVVVYTNGKTDAREKFTARPIY